MSACFNFPSDDQLYIVIKRFLEEEQLIEDSFRLATEVFKSGFRPTFIVGLWRGGSSVGIYVQECLQYLGVKTDHISLRTSYRGQPHYKTMIENPEQIRVHGTDYLIESLNADDSLLIVDDVYSTGNSVEAVLERLKKHLKLNMPAQVRVATLYQRATQNLTSNAPDYCLYQTEDWLVFPYELSGLSLAEVKEHKGVVADLIKPSRYR
jgi:hypoxanthine phosphoribosyltransferase